MTPKSSLLRDGKYPLSEIPGYCVMYFGCLEAFLQVEDCMTG